MKKSWYYDHETIWSRGQKGVSESLKSGFQLTQEMEIEHQTKLGFFRNILKTSKTCCANNISWNHCCHINWTFIVTKVGTTENIKWHQNQLISCLFTFQLIVYLILSLILVPFPLWIAISATYLRVGSASGVEVAFNLVTSTRTMFTKNIMFI